MSAEGKTFRKLASGDEHHSRELPSPESAAKELEAQLLRDEYLAWQDGEQKIYILPPEAGEQLLRGFPDAEPGEFTLTRVWRRTDTEAENDQNVLLQEIAARLQAMPDAASPVPSAAVDKDMAQFQGDADVVWQYGEEVYVLPNTAAVDVFLHKLSGSSAENFSQNRLWQKPVMTTDQKKQEALLEEIAERLRVIEAQLARLAKF
ncbi:hypothetical protein TcarDRAFT_2384 [Thermosinus carboxydivorans Nor1]|uniref:Uncharacterized protein n=1 Tax=Thermosinus carboxydivorans Nor1 TaxID=401526 RepID=A1HNT2_9FIRM|nr:hypothetical protein [Thermosinus carboxydivorans]EAX48434.1 hypothetical protein TcarDRAFT_2384 [Thermosinus carboxydivorans Nor1]